MDKQKLEAILEESKKYYFSNGEEGELANLREADLRGADLRGANLSGADLSGADLSGANLREANLRWANLRRANLREANLYEANLSGANLCGVDLHGANLYEVNLSGAALSGVDLCEASISNAIGNRKEICSTQIGEYPIVYTSTQLAIGCTQRSIEEWKDPTFLSKSQLYRWQEHSDFIWNILKRYPAVSR